MLYTSGPWYYSFGWGKERLFYVYSEAWSYTVCIVKASAGDKAKGNAAIISAGPQMYEFLSRLVDLDLETVHPWDAVKHLRSMQTESTRILEGIHKESERPDPVRGARFTQGEHHV